MFESKSKYIKALYFSLPIYLVVFVSGVILDYTNDGSINGVLNDGAGYYWLFMVLGPAVLLGLPWSIIGMIVFYLLGHLISELSEFMLGYQIVEIHGEFILAVTLFLSLYINGVISTKWITIWNTSMLLKLIASVYILIPLALIIL